MKPLPSRTGFEENDDWISLLSELDKIRSSIEAKVEELKQEEEEKKLTEIQRKAIELARDILNIEEFKDLELLEGLGRKPGEPRFPPIKGGKDSKKVRERICKYTKKDIFFSGKKY